MFLKLIFWKRYCDKNQHVIAQVFTPPPYMQMETEGQHDDNDEDDKYFVVVVDDQPRPSRPTTDLGLVMIRMMMIIMIMIIIFMVVVEEAM